jgi:ABC-type transport system involved in multi-copper enzyme maturation permease subunit
VDLLVFKFLGGLTFVLINSAIAIGGAWLILSVKTGLWTYSFPLTILVLTFFFAILYAVSALFGVLTRSSVLCIFMVCLVWFLLHMLGQFHVLLNADIRMVQGPKAPAAAGAAAEQPEKKTIADSDPTLRSVTDILNVVHAILPRTHDLSYLNTKIIADELYTEEQLKQKEHELVGTENYNWVESIGVSLAFIGVMLGLACWRFATRDY